MIQDRRRSNGETVDAASFIAHRSEESAQRRRSERLGMRVRFDPVLEKHDDQYAVPEVKVEPSTVVRPPVSSLMTDAPMPAARHDGPSHIAGTMIFIVAVVIVVSACIFQMVRKGRCNRSFTE